MLDLYCGVGPISLYLAVAARQMWAVDESELSINTAKQNARRNGRGNCRFVAGDVADNDSAIAQKLAPSRFDGSQSAAQGNKAAAMEAIVDLDAPKIIYVSCEPNSLARDSIDSSTPIIGSQACAFRHVPADGRSGKRGVIEKSAQISIGALPRAELIPRVVLRQTSGRAIRKALQSDR